MNVWCDDVIGYRSDIRAITKELKKDSLGLKNRLQSILYDAQYVLLSTNIFNDIPLVANERCGLWYIPKPMLTDTCYFKSTDGHTHHWKFSFRRLNLHLLSLFSNHTTIALVDSTRKGKIMPDALLKTLPIWCSVINSILFEDVSDQYLAKEMGLKEDVDVSFLLNLKENKWLLVPEEVISANEANEIRKKIDSFVAEVHRLQLFDKEYLIQKLGSLRPIVPQWLYPSKTRSKDAVIDNSVGPILTVLCITASAKVTNEDSRITVRYTEEGRISSTSWVYVQGSGDDHELWATKRLCDGDFTPNFFWNHIYNRGNKTNPSFINNHTGLIHDWITDGELITRINAEYNDAKFLLATSSDLDISYIRNASHDTNIAIGTIESNLNYASFIESNSEFQQVVIFSDKFEVQNIPKRSIKILRYEIDSSKKGAKQLRMALPQILPHICIENRILIMCESGKDISVGLALVLLCKNFDLEWSKVGLSVINKDVVRRHLSQIGDIRKVNPSRNTLQSVNSFLM
ncbi:uncharacterized protein PRCAT00002767001 [Priceomyces carsonii]|uniref:uncharacterized protein n=1 Tax=Priceomyces carsonii TaxID=28549 RepID=UPI002ED93A14|nr:unnamed protein product [Priceomyces carsonii]